MTKLQFKIFFAFKSPKSHLLQCKIYSKVTEIANYQVLLTFIKNNNLCEKCSSENCRFVHKEIHNQACHIHHFLIFPVLRCFWCFLWCFWCFLQLGVCLPFTNDRSIGKFAQTVYTLVTCMFPIICYSYQWNISAKLLTKWEWSPWDYNNSGDVKYLKFINSYIYSFISETDHFVMKL